MACRPCGCRKLGVHMDEYILAVDNVAEDEGDMFTFVVP